MASLLTDFIEVKLDDDTSLNFETLNGLVALNVLQSYIPRLHGLCYEKDNSEHEVLVQNGMLILVPDVSSYLPVFAEFVVENCGYDDVEQLIIQYFYSNCTYKEICARLQSQHNITMTVISLQRRIRRMGLSRKNIEESQLRIVVASMLNELGGSGKLIGYRAMWLRLKIHYRLDVKQSTVCKLLRELDPDGVENRTRGRLKRRLYRVPGPNHIWHIDGYDKIKRYGFAIHGAVDGFSKRIIWLRVATTNNKPEVIVHYYLESITQLRFMPSIIRSDRGTENTKIEIVHKALRLCHNDSHAGANSFYKGKSTANERIEKFWRQLRNHTMEYFICLFKELEQKNLLDVGSDLHINFLRYCFGPVIEFELHRTKTEWNEHRIRKQNLVNLPAGIPNVMFWCPEKYEGRNCRKDFCEYDVCELMKTQAATPILYDPNIESVIQFLEPDVAIPTNTTEALELFLRLTAKANAVFQMHAQ